MRFALSDEQELLRKTVDDLSSTLFTPENLRTALDDDGAFAADAWARLTELDLPGMLVPEADGGAGGSLTDACVVAESLGRHIAPVPYVGTAIAAAALLRHGNGGRETLGELCQGAPVAVLLGDDLDWAADQAVTALGWGVGARGVVSVSADRVEVVEPTGAVLTESASPLQRVFRIDPVTTVPGASEGLRRARAMASVGSAAMLTGLADGALHEAVDYAKQREQYGRPIGSFQAIQHLCAEMLVEVETSRSVMLGASWEVEHLPIEQAERIAAAAKAQAATAALQVCENGIQILGGIGVTWEHDAHLRLRSVHTLAAEFGGAPSAFTKLANIAFDTAAAFDTHAL